MIILYAALFTASLIGCYSQVKYGKEVQNFFGVALYSVITCAIAIVFFFFMTGFSPKLNQTIVMFSLMFSAVVIVSQYLGIIIYKYMSVLSYGLIRNSLTLILTFSTGAVFYNEKITLIALIRMILSALATVFLVLKKEQSNTTVKKQNMIYGYIICFVLILSGVFTTVLSKEFALLPQKQDENSYFMLVNIFCLMISVLVIVIIEKGRFQNVLTELKSTSAKEYLYIILSTVSSNLTSLLTVWLLASNVSVVLYAPLTAAINVITQVITAKITANERIPLVPVSLSIISAMLVFAE